jgi:type II secretory pathway pseudopilin PulG
MGSLASYVSERAKAGIPKAEIKEELLSVGWSEEEADAAYRDGVIALGVPVPSEDDRPVVGKKASVGDVVLNFFSFILLGIIATALGTLYYGIISEAFPDPLETYYSSASTKSSIHYAIAALLIGFPLYYAAMRMWFRAFRDNESRSESKLSKWVTYLVLLAASITIVGDLIAVVFTLLQGEITLRFFLKALTILAIAGSIFGFYFLERKMVQYRKDVPRPVFQRFGLAVAVIVILGIVLGFFMGGSPETARKQSFDTKRSNDLSSLSSCIQNYASDLGALPVSFSDLKQSSTYAYCSQYMRDPETLSEYEYRIVTASKAQGAARVGEFELCADFSLAASNTDSADTTYQGYGYRSTILGDHVAGRECDTVTAQLGTLAIPTPLIK